jgi:hypothetical protein
MSYGKSDLIAKADLASIGNVELDVLTITDGAKLKDSQFNIFLKAVLGANTEIRVRYYARTEVGGDWYLIPYKNETTGDLTNLPSIIDSLVLQVVDSTPVPACFAFKITATGDSGTTNGTLSATVMSRDNYQ